MVSENSNIEESLRIGLEAKLPEVEVVSTHLGKPGVDMVKSKAPDIVLLDIGLPDMSGFEVLRQMRSFSNIPVIVLTVNGSQNDIVDGLQLGADDYMVKPFRLVELAERIKAVTRRRDSPRW